MGEGDSRRLGGRIKVRIALSALEVRRLVPSGDLEAVRKVDSRGNYVTPLGALEVIGF
jgi:hypothetical protein